MKLVDEFKNMPKDLVYEMYLAIVYDCKDYDEISRPKMLESIVKQYQEENYLYNICTTRELDFLKYISNNKITAKDLKKYDWEIKTLNEKAIFSMVTLDIFEEQRKSVQEALKFYENAKNYNEKDALIFMIGFTRMNLQIATQALESIITGISNIDHQTFEILLSAPLFHYYCEFSYEYNETLDKELEFINYRNYWDLLDDFEYELQKYGRAGTLNINFQDFKDIFYYGVPIHVPSVKKMYDEISKRTDKWSMLRLIEEVRILHNTIVLDTLITDKKLYEIITEALMDMPCAVMNSLTPKEYLKDIETEEELDSKLTIIPQLNAHLTKKEADLYYKIYFALLEYTNNKYHVSNITKIYKQNYLNPEILKPINKYLWEHKKILNDFINDNLYNFNKEELDIVANFKTAKMDYFTVCGFTEEYTMFLSKDGILYMVKGIRDNLDNILNVNNLPIILETTLLMFKDKIIYNGFVGQINMGFGTNLKKTVLEEIKTALVYYHL